MIEEKGRSSMDLLNSIQEIEWSTGFGILSPETHVMVEAVIEAADAIQRCSPRGKAKTYEGPRSIVTAADYRSQEVICRKLIRKFPKARILSEEKTANAAALSHHDPSGILGVGLHFVVDPIDGTIPFSHGQADWSIGVGVIRDGHFLAGVVFAPMINGGLLVVGEHRKGVFLKEGDRPLRRMSRPLGGFSLRTAIVKVGGDARFYSNLRPVETEIAINVQAVYVAGSGLLALAEVALGRVALVIQPPENPWDWAQAVPLLLESDRSIWFFRLEKGSLVAVPMPDQRAFTSPRERNGLGFIAGEPALVEKVRCLLPRSGWECIEPNKVVGLWGTEA
jgi:myo-inositol-1(or 4)-monophosphatase